MQKLPDQYRTRTPSAKMPLAKRAFRYPDGRLRICEAIGDDWFAIAFEPAKGKPWVGVNPDVWRAWRAGDRDAALTMARIAANYGLPANALTEAATWAERSEAADLRDRTRAAHYWPLYSTAHKAGENEKASAILAEWFGLDSNDKSKTEDDMTMTGQSASGATKIPSFEWGGKRLTFQKYTLVGTDEPTRSVYAVRGVDLGKLLDYGHQGGRLVSKITSDWAAEFEEGVEYFRGAIRVDSKTPTDSVGVGNEAVWLTPEGVHSVTLLTRKPIGLAMRKWLRREVMPQIAATGGYQSEHATPTPTLTSPSLDAATLATTIATAIGAALAPLFDRHAPVQPAPAPVPTKPAPPARALPAPTPGPLLALDAEKRAGNGRWAEYRRLRAEGASAKSIARLYGVRACSVRAAFR
jgi:prophage antirepressor-like protein